MVGYIVYTNTRSRAICDVYYNSTAYGIATVVISYLPISTTG